MPAWVAFGWSLWTLLGAHLFFLRPPALLHFYDEGYINAFAWRMIDGHMLPYVDAVSHRGPLLYWIAALAAKLGSPTSWVPIRICSLVVTIAPVIFIFAAAYRAKKPLAGGIAAIATVVALLLALGPGDGIAFNGEHVLNVFATAAFFSLVVALDRRRPTPSVALVGLAGALAAMSALSKQVGAAMIPALALWVIAAAVSRRSLERSQRWKLVLAFAAGVAVPVATVLLRYAVVHELNTFIYWAIRYNSEIYMAPYAHAIWRTTVNGWMAEHVVLLSIAIVTIGWGLTWPIARANRMCNLACAWDEEGFRATVSLEALLAIAASNAALRDFPHYYVQVVPWCGLLLGLFIEHALVGGGSHRSTYRAAVIVLPALFFTASVWHHRVRAYRIDRATHNAWQDSRNGPICVFVREHSSPTDKLFVWGFLPELYTSCDRRSASRYVFTTFVAGVVPWFGNTSVEEEDRRAVPGSREILLSELEAAKPPVIVDAAQTTLANRSMARYAVLSKYLDDHYCPAGEQQALKVYLRKTPEGACPP